MLDIENNAQDPDLTTVEPPNLEVTKLKVAEEIRKIGIRESLEIEGIMEYIPVSKPLLPDPQPHDGPTGNTKRSNP